MAKYRLPYLACPWAAYEIKTLIIGDVAKTYGIDWQNILKDLNKINYPKS